MSSFFYYLLDFNYTGRKSSFGEGDGVMAALSAAETKVEEGAQNAKRRGIDIIHAYSWPDGSLYKHARSPERISRGVFEEIFNSEIVRISNVTEVGDYQELSSDLLTLEECFSLTREAKNALYHKRAAQSDRIGREYHLARHDCKVCSVPGLPCKACNILFEKTQRRRDAWLKKPRPLKI